MVVTYTYVAGTNTCTISGAGSTNFAALVAADTAGGWGKYTADATGTQIILDGQLVVGDGTNALTCSDSGKEIIIKSAASGQLAVRIYVRNNAVFTLGVLNSETYKTTSQGCALYLVRSSYGHAVLFNAESSAATINLYGCQLYYTVLYWGRMDLFIKHGDVYNTLLSSSSDVQFASSTATFFNVMGTNAQLFKSCSGSTFVNCRITGQNTYAAISEELGSTSVYTNLYIRDVSKLLQTWYLSTGCNVSFINADSDNWSIEWNGDPVDHAGRVLRRYEFDLTTDTSALCVLKDNAGITIFSVTSDAATGVIATQTVSRGYYNQANGDTLQDYGPFTLTVSKAGKDTHTETLTLTEKTKLQITLETPVIPDYSKPTWAITKQQYDKIVKDEAEPYMMATAVLLLQRQRDKRMIRALSK
jgi:hypothetical protein